MNKENLHEYQIAAYNHIIKKRYCALFLDMGLGKTVSTLTAINILMFEELDISKVLIIAPKRVVESVWAEECEKWSHLNHIKCSKIMGSEPDRKKALKDKADIYLISRDNISWLCKFFGGEVLPFDMLVIDELSSFKNSQSVRFKALKKVQPCFRRIVGLTGTPAPNGLIDIWSQIFLIDRGERLGRFITQYRERYFKPDKRNGAIIYSYKVTKEGEKQIYSKINDICLSMKSEDYLQLPGGIIENNILLNLPDNIKKDYDYFEEEQVLKLIGESGEISALNAAALSTKCLQFANGGIYDEDKNIHEIHNVKIDAVKEIIEDANGKSVLIAWTYRHDEIRLVEALSQYNPRKLKTSKDIEDWNNGDIRVLMMHPASGGHGLNLQNGGNIIIWFGQTWSLELLQQFNARLYRQGQQNTVIINKLIIKDTIDEEVIKAQRNKQFTQDNLIDAVKAKIDKYLTNVRK